MTRWPTEASVAGIGRAESVRRDLVSTGMCSPSPRDLKYDMSKSVYAPRHRAARHATVLRASTLPPRTSIANLAVKIGDEILRRSRNLDLAVRRTLQQRRELARER